MEDQQLRFPIGKFEMPLSYTGDEILKWTAVIRNFPVRLRQVTATLSETQLDTPYRPGGWTIRQVVHHLADSHMNSIVRFKLALTEDNPTIKPYEEAGWAMLPDYQLPVEPSLQILEGVHQHLAALFESFGEAELNRTFHHPETGADVPLKRNIALYAWHSEHHLGHIRQALNQL